MDNDAAVNEIIKDTDDDSAPEGFDPTQQSYTGSPLSASVYERDTRDGLEMLSDYARHKDDPQPGLD